MKIKVCEASGVMLDWLVAKCEEERTHYHDYRVADGELQVMYCDIWWTAYAPSTNWVRGGPIIEREEITIGCGDDWWAVMGDEPNALIQHGPTPLVAAMRCFCVSRLGEEVEVPDELA